jgi:transposase
MGKAKPPSGEKVAILRWHLIDRVSISDLCDEYQLSPTLFYAWQKLSFENGASAFERKSGSADQSHVRNIAALRDKLQCKPPPTRSVESDVRTRGPGNELQSMLPFTYRLLNCVGAGVGVVQPLGSNFYHADRASSISPLSGRV